MSQLLEVKRLKMTQTNSDSEDDSSEDEDSDDEALEDNSPSTAGVIEKIVLKNFMCHDSFELNLGPQLNFIIGRNGSGKSAILTGISVGLGAKATDTSRGSSIKSLIKDDKSTARVSITLSNLGEDAFEPNQFGSKIIIERKIVRQGTNSYYIKSENGKTISTRKVLLDEILHKFNITVDNPMAFLSQDRAREFLTTTTDHNKYDYFMSGSSIEDILDKYSLTSQNIQQVRDKLKLTRTHFDAATKKYEEAAALYNQFKKSDNLRKQLHLLNGKIFWFNVQTVEKKIQLYNNKIRQHTDEIAELDAQETTTNEELTNRNNQRVEIAGELLEAANKIIDLTEKISKQSEEFSEVKESIKACEDDLEEGQNEIKNNKREIKNYQKGIDSEQERINQQQGGSKETLSEKLDVCESKRKELKSQESKLTSRYEELRSSVSNNKSPALQEIIEKLQSLDASIEASKKHHANLASSQKDRYSPWGPATHLLLKEIRKTTGWHKQPYGPLGSFVSIKKEFAKWHDLINTMYTRSLDSFVVCDDHDRKILSGLINRLRIQNKNIVVRKYERYDYLSGKASNHLTISDILSIENVDIFFTLIDINNMEREVLCDNQEAAKSAVSDQKVSNAYCLHDNRGANRFSGNSSNLKLDPVTYNRGSDKLSRGNQVTTEDLNKVLQQIEEDQTERQKLNRKYRELKIKEENDKEIESKTLVTQIKNIRQELKILDAKIFKITDQLKDDGDLGRISALEEKIEECKQNIIDKHGIMAGVKSELEQLFISSELIRDKLKLLNKQKNDAVIKEEDKKKILRDFDIQGAQLSSNIDHYRIGIKKREKAIEDLNEKIFRKEEQKNELLEIAQEKCTRDEAPIDPEDTSQSITNEYVYVKGAITEAEKHMGKSYQEVQQELLSSKQMKDQLEDLLTDLHKTERALDDDLANRFSYMNTTINKSITEATFSFEESLALRGFKGELKFGFADKTLAMLVQTPNDDQPRTVESLSGGEKSFTQIALLLAIWRVMDSRIRGLDEFDVFMDSINRTISIKLLLSQLRMYPKSQSIFITPQDITSFAELERPDVKIHQMHSPRND